jgi:hypothetical protein
MRGSANEGAVVAALSSNHSLRLYTSAVCWRAQMRTGLRALRMECSPDGMALINVSELGLVGDASSSATGNALLARYELASVEIKTCHAIKSGRSARQGHCRRPHLHCWTRYFSQTRSD